MKKSLTLALALVALAVLSGFGFASEQGGTAPQQPLPCCKCLGESHTLDLSTGQGSGPKDPLWKVTPTGGFAFIAPTNVSPSWCTTLGARWIGPVASPSNVAPGVYRYTVSFNVPKC